MKESSLSKRQQTVSSAILTLLTTSNVQRNEPVISKSHEYHAKADARPDMDITGKPSFHDTIESDLHYELAHAQRLQRAISIRRKTVAARTVYFHSKAAARRKPPLEARHLETLRQTP